MIFAVKYALVVTERRIVAYKERQVNFPRNVVDKASKSISYIQVDTNSITLIQQQAIFNKILIYCFDVLLIKHFPTSKERVGRKYIHLV